MTAGVVASPDTGGDGRWRGPVGRGRWSTGGWALSLTGTTTPARLRRVGAVLVLGCVAAAVVSLLGGLDRAEVVGDADTRLAALTTDAAVIYQVLADADASATSGYIAGGREPPAVRVRYDGDLAIAARRLVHAAGLLSEGDPAMAPVTTLTTRLPVYAGLMDTARTYNRQGLPLGQSYLLRASRLMRSTMLPAAAQLRTIVTDRLTAAYRQGSAAPLAVLVLGLGLLVAVVDLAAGERARTNRVLSPGLVGCAVAVLVALLWWTSAWAFAGGALADAGRRTAAVTALDDARTAVLQARSNESLALAAGVGDTVDLAFVARVGELLAQAEARGAAVAGVRDATLTWWKAHNRVRELDDDGEFDAAVQAAIEPTSVSSGSRFAGVELQLTEAANAERAGQAAAIDRAGVAQSLLAIGPAVLFVLAAAAAVVGIGRRVGEYR